MYTASIVWFDTMRDYGKKKAREAWKTKHKENTAMNTTKTTYNNEYNEYRVRLFVDGEYQAGADYFTDDKKDAASTAKYMRDNGLASDKTSAFAIDELETYLRENGCLYDVCNDYSLDVCFNEPILTGYDKEFFDGGIVYREIATGEIHYYLAAHGLDGKTLNYN